MIVVSHRGVNSLHLYSCEVLQTLVYITFSRRIRSQFEQSRLFRKG
jgi:hypothetical protein